ncbi:MAG: rod shape-determining protein MreD [Rhodospirillaceae bacterium]|jgi:rod shape-determining protein MreD|nr:rod shape-determining protein MreD [Rhodospirillaceae bacterium]MBT6137137.1 rod shape-determining protein MreD [Rhodospirillaceae bacterium]
MKSPAVQRLDRLARDVTPALTITALAIFTAIPLGFPGLQQVTPAYTMMAVFYWAVYRPDLLSPITVFAIGLLQDVVLGQPLGLSALTLLAVLGVTVSQRQAFIAKPFVLAWLGFVVIAAGAFLLVWMLMMLTNLTIILPPAALYQYAVTVAVFPLVAWVFVRIHRNWVR